MRYFSALRFFVYSAFLLPHVSCQYDLSTDGMCFRAIGFGNSIDSIEAPIDGDLFWTIILDSDGSFISECKEEENGNIEGLYRLSDGEINFETAEGLLYSGRVSSDGSRLIVCFEFDPCVIFEKIRNKSAPEKNPTNTTNRD